MSVSSQTDSVITTAPRTRIPLREFPPSWLLLTKGPKFPIPMFSRWFSPIDRPQSRTKVELREFASTLIAAVSAELLFLKTLLMITGWLPKTKTTAPSLTPRVSRLVAPMLVAPDALESKTVFAIRAVD